jgi:putative ABC transport system permease protein
MLASIFADVPTQADGSATKLEHSAELRAAVRQMQKNKRTVMMDRRQLQNIQKRVGDRFAVTGINFQGIDLEFEIIAAFPEGRYVAVMNRDYLNDALDSYPKTHAGLKHPLAGKSLNRVWLQVPTQETFSRIAEQIESSGLFQDPQVKCETLSSMVVTQLDSYRDLMWGMRWLLSPAILITMALVIANAISLSVRERRTEIAVLKVLGFRPVQILSLVLGEAVLIGGLSGLISSLFVFQAVNRLVDNSASFLPVYVPKEALWWGGALGALAAVAGSLLPAWLACRVKVAEVFARIA